MFPTIDRRAEDTKQYEKERERERAEIPGNDRRDAVQSLIRPRCKERTPEGMANRRRIDGEKTRRSVG